MGFIPQDQLKSRESLNLAPMIDFLFLMLMFFATLAVSRATTKDTDIDLVEAKQSLEIPSTQHVDYQVVNINIGAAGDYKWVTEIHDYPMNSPEEIAQELVNQYQKGILPADKMKTQVLLKIDKSAAWEPILKAILAIKEAGFEVRPVYVPELEQAQG